MKRTLRKNVFAFFALLFAAGAVNAQCTVTTPTAANASINCGSSATLTASGSTAYQWWNQPVGGTLLAGTATYTTPALTGNTSYYVEGMNSTPQAMMGLPAQSSTLTPNARGFYFTAPVNFTITGLKLPPEISGLQNISVVRLAATPPLFSATTNAFTVLYLTQNNPATGILPVNIPIVAGDIIGILGQAGTTNSYGSGNYATTIGGQPVTLSRLGMQFPLNTTAPQDLWTESGGSISRVEMYYTVTCLSPRVQVDVAVTPIPVAATATTGTICEGSSTTLNASGAANFSWMPGNLSGSSVSVTPAATTTYTVTGSDPSGCSNTALVTVIVSPLPTVSATASAPAVCSGSPDVLTATGGTTYAWSSGGTTDIETVTPTSTTTYTVTGTDANGCQDTATVMVMVNALPDVIATATPGTICAGDSDMLMATGATSYVWSSGSTTDMETVTPALTSTYTVTGTDANGCVNTATATVNVNPLPTVNANSTASTVCEGGSVTLTGGGATTYTWSGNVTDAVAFTPVATETYTVTGTDANGCSNTATTTVVVNTLPAVVANSSTAAVCAGGFVTLSGSGATSYTWSSNVTDLTPFVPAATATYTVTGTDANGCVNTDAVTVTVNPLPAVTASSTVSNACLSDASVALTGSPSGGTWSGPGVTGSTFSPSAAGTGAQTVVYTYSDANGCDGTASVEIVVSACVGINEQASDNSVIVFPNPNNGTFTITSANGASDLVITIMDMQGRVVYASNEDNVQAGFTKQVSLEKEAAGLYFVSITANGEQHTVKVAVQK